jgi:hypothetical protein
MKPHVFSPRLFSTLVASVLFFSSFVVAQQRDLAGPSGPIVNGTSAYRQDALDLMKTLAQDLKTQPDKPSAAVLQARLADVLWKFDEEFAREVFRWAFEAARKLPPEELSKTDRATYAARQATGIREVLTRLGTHDRKQAEAWLKTLEEEKTQESRSLESNSFRSDLLMQIALQLANNNPAQAKRLGLLSLAGGQIPEGFGRLLFALSRVSRSQSDELFRAALATLQRNEYTYDTALIILINYLFSSGDVLDSNATVDDAQLLANYFVDAAWHQARGTATAGLPEASAGLYSLIEVRGWSIVSRYAPERVPELQGQMRELASRLSQAQFENTARLRTSQQQQVAVSRQNNYDIDEQIERALKEKDAEVRDSLLNSVAHSLMRANNEKALEAAGKIQDAEVRTLAEDDINLVRIQQLLDSRSYVEARKATLKLSNPMMQAKVLVELASKVFSQHKDAGRAAELLSEAFQITLKSEPVPDKLMSLLLIAQQFARFDSIRGFETLGSAIKTVNQLKGGETPQSVLAKPRLLTIKTYTVINGHEMSSDDRATFDSIDFSQVAPFVAHDYIQTRLLGNQIEHPLRRAKFLTAVASALLLKAEEHPERITASGSKPPAR